MGGATLTAQSSAWTDPTRPPSILPLLVEGLPLDDLSPYPNFVGWDLEWREGKNGEGCWTKVPKNPRTGRNARSNAPKTWGTVADVIDRFERAGFVLSDDDPFTFIDIDNAIDLATGATKSWAQAIVACFPRAYWEVSPSGTGLKGLIRGKTVRNREYKLGDGKVEVFSRVKFTTLTGHRLEGSSTTVGECQAELDRFLADFCPSSPVTPLRVLRNTEASPLNDEDVMRRALAAGNGAKFARLWAGDTSDYDGDDSRADLALCSIFAFWTQDPNQIDRLIRRSGLMRSKWDERRGEGTYGSQTIAKALQRADVYPAPATATGATVANPHDVGATADPCAPVRDELAELRDENASLRAELDRTRVERDQARRDLSMVMKVLDNPELGGDAAGKALVLAAAEVQYQRGRFHPEDGYCRVSASRVADNRAFITDETGERSAVAVPSRVSPRTVTKYLRLASERGLIDAQKRPVMVPKGDRDVKTEVWHWKAAPTLADQLAPLAGGSVYSEDNPRPLRGGDPAKRRLVKALPGCPECGGHGVACTSCGVMYDMPAGIDLRSGEILGASQVASAQADHSHSVPTLPPPVDVVSLADKFAEIDHSHTVRVDPPGLDPPRPIRGPMSPPSPAMSDYERPWFPADPEARRALAFADLERRELERQQQAQLLPAASAPDNGCAQSQASEARASWQAVALPGMPRPVLDPWTDLAPGAQP
jgi:hypothetical protein